MLQNFSLLYETDENICFRKILIFLSDYDRSWVFFSSHLFFGTPGINRKNYKKRLALVTLSIFWLISQSVSYINLPKILFFMYDHGRSYEIKSTSY